MLVCSLFVYVLFFFFKQKTAYEMRISDWSSDVCSSDLRTCLRQAKVGENWRNCALCGRLSGAVRRSGRDLPAAECAFVRQDRLGIIEALPAIGPLAQRRVGFLGTTASEGRGTAQFAFADSIAVPDIHARHTPATD